MLEGYLKYFDFCFQTGTEPNRLLIFFALIDKEKINKLSTKIIMNNMRLIYEEEMVNFLTDLYKDMALEITEEEYYVREREANI